MRLLFGFVKKWFEIAINILYIHVITLIRKHGGPLIAEVINITLEGWTLANNFHAQDEMLVKSPTFWHFQKIKSEKMVSLNSSHHWILQGFETNDNRWEGLTRKDKKLSDLAMKVPKFPGCVWVGELLGASLGMKKSLS